MESEHRKLELQSPGDLSYITTQIRSSARRKLDTSLPPVSGSNEPDDLRRKTEELVDAFVNQVLEGMRNNISINGIDVTGSGEEATSGDAMQIEVEEYEDLDNKLRERLRTTVAKRDALIGKIAQHRRTTAATASQKYKDAFTQEMGRLAREKAEQEEMAVVVGEGEAAGVEALKRQDEVESNWERAVEGLIRVNKGLPETRARLERAGEVVGYLEGGKKMKD